MTDKDAKSKTPVELKEAELDKVAGGFKPGATVSSKVVSGPIPKGDGIKVDGTKISYPDGFASTASANPTV